MKIIPVSEIDDGDPDLKSALNYNPWLFEYTSKQPETGRNPLETDRGGWRGYNKVYSKYLSEKKLQKLNILEIGVHSGYGLLSWASYFKNSKITGIEIDISWAVSHHKLLMKHEEYSRVQIKYFNSTKPSEWENNIREKFDIIIDDGSHSPLDQLKTFSIASNYLKSGGVYFIEDISSRYYNPGMEIIFDKLTQLENNGFYVSAYSHKNEGWQKILSDKSIWNKYGVTENTPKIAEDYIAVIKFPKSE